MSGARQDWKALVLELFAGHQKEFTAGDVRATVEAHLYPPAFDYRIPEEEQIRYPQREPAQERWRRENPGTSEGNMRRVCEALVRDGHLTVRADVRGWYVRHFYKLVNP